VGYHGDQSITMWPYRDYVIAAFNGNKPFDQFTLEQLAGDLLPSATREQKIAASYNRLNMMSAEGGGQDKEYLAKYAADRVRATSGAWLGGGRQCRDLFSVSSFASTHSTLDDLEAALRSPVALDLIGRQRLCWSCSTRSSARERAAPGARRRLR
jgi:hypothetical protein